MTDPGEARTSCSAAWFPPFTELISVNPVPGVRMENCVPPMTKSFEKLVEIVADEPVPNPLAVPGSETFGSKVVVRLAPLTPKPMSPLYSPP